LLTEGRLTDDGFDGVTLFTTAAPFIVLATLRTPEERAARHGTNTTAHKEALAPAFGAA
jgi:hypothetical protein